jgi:hypothetical protein
MALPEGFKPKEYLPTEQDFAKVLAAKQNGNYFALPWLATASICFLNSSSSIK